MDARERHAWGRSGNSSVRSGPKSERVRYASTPGTWYAQARAQARWADHPSTNDWARLERVGDFNLLVQEARSVPLLAELLKSVEADASSHRIECAIRDRYRQTVDDLAQWAPAAWREAIGWTRWLVDLPVVGAAAGNGTSPAVAPWLSDDEVWSSLVQTTPEQRATTLLASLWAATDVFDAWFNQWRALWPSGDAELERLVDEALATKDAVARGDGEAVVGEFRAGCLRRFRRHSGTIAALLAFLALTWIDLARARALLLQRRLFAAGAPA